MPPVRIVFFDVDGVLVPIKSSWQYLHEYFGVEKTALEALRMYERGEITYYEWMVIDTSLWIRVRSKVTKRELEEAFKGISVDPGFREIISRLKSEGKTIVLVSGGVDVLVQRVAREVEADECYCNKLIFGPDGSLVPGGFPIVPSGSKDIVVKHVLRKHGVPKEGSVFVGDSRWDSEAFKEVGLAILYGDNKAPEHGSCRTASSAEEVYRLIREYEEGGIECHPE